MEQASAAAAASTPSIKGGVFLDSFDARIVEYQCAIRKLEVLTVQVKAVSIKARSQGVVPLVHYIATLAGPWIGGAHDVLKKRLDQVARLEVLRDARKISPPIATMPISFDVDESAEHRAPDYTRQDVNFTVLLENLQSIFENALTIYQGKLKQCVLERDAHRRPDANHKPVPLDMNSFKDILEPFEVLSLSKLVAPKSELGSCHFKIVAFLLESINKSIQTITKFHNDLQTYKKRTTDAIFKRLPAWEHTNHRIFACFVKLGELYNILRKLGRDSYLPVSDDLHSPKLLHNNVKLEQSLIACDDHLKSTRKNELIVFTLTKATRQGSYSHIKRDVVLAFTQSLEQAIALDVKLLSVIGDYVKNWEVADAKEKRNKSKLDAQMARERAESPQLIVSPGECKKVNVLFNPLKEKLTHEAIARQQRERERIGNEERTERERLEKERQAVEDIKAKRRIEERERSLRNDLIKDRSPTVSRSGSLMKTQRQRSGSNASMTSLTRPMAPATRQRSGSNASTTSNSSNSSVLNSMRNNSLTNHSQRSPSTISRSPSLQVRRPVSMYMSSAAFDIRSELRRQEKAKAAAVAAAAVPIGSPSSMSPPTIALKRTPSLPTRQSPRSNLVSAAAGAASALKSERHSSLKSQAEIRQRQLSQQQTLGVNTSTSTRRSPSPLKYQAHSEHLPDINELFINNDSSVIRRPRPTSSTLSAPQVTSKIEFSPSPMTITPTGTIMEEEVEDFPQSHTQTTPSKTISPAVPVSDSPSLKPLLKSSMRSLDPGTSTSTSTTLDHQSTPELSSTTETTSESSVSTSDHGYDEPQEGHHSLLAIPETIPPKKVVKKVRFIGVPDEVEEVKPKRKGWIHPPKLPLMKSPNKSQTSSLSFAAQALVQQERMTFSSIKRGQFDMKTGKVVYPEKTTRLMNTLAGGGQQTTPPKGKWGFGGKLKDRFA